AVILALTLGACASSSLNLPYKPEIQPSGATLSAAYAIIADRVRVEIATDGRRLERAQIVRPDGSLLEAQTIEYTPPVGGGGRPVRIRCRLGWRRRRGEPGRHRVRHWQLRQHGRRGQHRSRRLHRDHGGGRELRLRGGADHHR